MCRKQRCAEGRDEKRIEIGCMMLYCDLQGGACGSQWTGCVKVMFGRLKTHETRNPMSYVFSHKVAPGVDVRATLCETTYIGHRVS